ncbi:MAG: hypothetical protein ACXWTH_00515 [Methylosarcina sp.]
MSTAWAGGTDAIVERMEQMTNLFIEETRKSIYTGESATHCEECGEPIPEKAAERQFPANTAWLVRPSWKKIQNIKSRILPVL